MDIEEVPEEHRKHLLKKDNPTRVPNASIFSLLSEMETKVSKFISKMPERMAVVEIKQDQTYQSLCELDEKVDRKLTEQDEKITATRDDFQECQLKGIGLRSERETENKWIMRAMGLVISLSLVTLYLLFVHLGVEIPVP
jgi:hypothetical protein